MITRWLIPRERWDALTADEQYEAYFQEWFKDFTLMDALNPMELKGVPFSETLRKFLTDLDALHKTSDS